jgi:hypothetical protein
MACFSKREREAPIDAVLWVVADGPCAQVTRMRIRVQDYGPLGLKDAHGEEDRARRTVEDSIPDLQGLKLRNYTVGARGFPMTHARPLDLLAGKGFEVFIYWLVPPGGVGVSPEASIVTAWVVSNMG